MPNEPLDIEKWRKEYALKLEERGKELSEKASKKGYVERSNKETSFKYHVAMINEPEDYDDEVGFQRMTVRVTEYQIDGDWVKQLRKSLQPTKEYKPGK